MNTTWSKEEHSIGGIWGNTNYLLPHDKLEKQKVQVYTQLSE